MLFELFVGTPFDITANHPSASLQLIGNLIIFITYVFALSLMVNRRLLGDVTAQSSALDVTNRSLETALTDAKQLTREAQAANIAKSAFLANMSHEIRTPMNSILGYAELLEDEELTPERRRRYLEIVRSRGKNLVGIIGDILDFAKIESGKLELARSPFDIRLLVRETMLTIGERAVEKGIELTSSVDEFLPVNAVGDQLRVQQVILNLLTNAIKFTDKGSVSLELMRERLPDGILEGPARIRFTVRDTGVGIPKERIDAIFDPFVQADTSDTRSFGGTGLGLSIVRSLVHQMGGVVTVASKPGTGTTFTVVIPFAVYTPPPEDMPGDTAPSGYRPDSGVDPATVRILIVDDDETGSEFAGTILSARGYPVTVAGGGEQALSLYRRSGADIVITDIQMPGMDGWEVIRQITCDEDRPPSVIILTASARVEDRERAMETGIADYIIKPFDSRELILAVERCAAMRNNAPD